MRHAVPWSEDGMVKGPLFEWRSEIPEGAGLHPTLNDVDLESLDEDEYRAICDVDSRLDEDTAMLCEGGEVDYKKILLRSVCDLLLESNDKKAQSTAIFVDTVNGRCSESQYKALCDLFHVKC